MMRIPSAAAVVALIVALSTPTSAQAGLGFEPDLTIGAVEAPELVDALDLTGDGHLDIAVSSSSRPQLGVLIGPGFASLITSTLPAPALHQAFGDMNGDGAPDLVVANDLPLPAVHVLLGDGAGGFAPAGSVDLSSLPVVRGLALLDADEDGALDVAVTQAGVVRIAPGDGAGGLAPPSTTIVLGEIDVGRDVHALQADTDDHTDLLVVGWWGWGFDWTLYLGDGQAGFVVAPGPSEASLDATLYGSAIGDLDGDGRPDLLVSFYDYYLLWDPGDLQIGRNTGTTIAGQYPEDVAPTPTWLDHIAIADLDGDGLGDVAGSLDHHTVRYFYVMLGDGSGGFAPAATVPTVEAPGRLVLADVNGDTVPDVVAANPWSDSVTVLVNTSLPPGWSVVGEGLAGTAGVPELAGLGPLVGGEQVLLVLSSARRLAPTALVLGFSEVSLPFKGGVMVPRPDLLLTGLTTDAAGTWSVSAPWPPGVPAGFTTWLQMWILDPAGPAGFSASNGLAAKAQSG
jgi:hypothetical protein